VGWFYLDFFSASYMGFAFFPCDFSNPSLPTNYPTLNFVPDVPPPKLFERTRMGTHPTMARSIQIHPLEISTSPTARSRRHPLLDPTSLPEDRKEWPTFLSRGRLPKAGDRIGTGEGEGNRHLAPPPHVLWTGRMRTVFGAA